MSSPGAKAAELRITNREDDLAKLFAWLDSSVGTHRLSEALVYKLHVVAEEAMMNVAKHAYAPGEAAEFLMQFEVRDDAALLVVVDDGPAFDPVSAALPAPPANLEDAKPGGLGIALMRRYCPDLRYERAGQQNRLTFRFPLEPV